MSMRIYYRTYDKRKVDGKPSTILKTWIQRKCERCKKFLSKREKRFCDSCRELKKLYNHQKCQQSKRDLIFYYSKESIKDSIGLSLPRWVHRILGEYL
jgi:hypothetical protein